MEYDVAVTGATEKATQASAAAMKGVAENMLFKGRRQILLQNERN